MDNLSKDRNSAFAACSSAVSFFNYSPSPTSTQNDLNDTFSTSTSNDNTPNPIPIPIPISLQTQSSTPIAIITPIINPNNYNLNNNKSIQPFLTSMNGLNHLNINNQQRIIRMPPLSSSILNHNNNHFYSNLPPLPLPEIMQTQNNNNNNNYHKSQSLSLPILSHNNNSECSSRSVSISPIVDPNNGESYSVIRSAFNHNLRVKRMNVHKSHVEDVVFDQCYIFSMVCPYTDCHQGPFDSMSEYQSHHIEHHQLRDPENNNKLIQTKEAKWKCPDCNKISASWYNYAAHVTMHKDSCDAPWICKLPPLNKKKYIQWTNGKLICGKRCSTKHNLIKHLKALHVSHRIVDLTQSVSSKQYNEEYSPRKIRNKKMNSKKRMRKKRPIFNKECYQNNNNNNLNTNPMNISISSIQPPRKKIKLIDPNTKNNNNLLLSVYNTNIENENQYQLKSNKPNKSVKEQSNFVDLLLAAANLLEKEDGKKTFNLLDKPSAAAVSPVTVSDNISISNVSSLISSIKQILNSSSSSLSSPTTINTLNVNNNYNMNKLSAIILNINNEIINKEKDQNNQINITNLTKLSSIPLPNGDAPETNIISSSNDPLIKLFQSNKPSNIKAEDKNNNIILSMDILQQLPNIIP